MMRKQVNNRKESVDVTIKNEVKKLNIENQLVFGRIQGFVLDPNYFKPATSKALLLEIVNHFVEGQENGVTAKSIVGDDIESYCHDLARNLPQVHGGQLRTAILAAGATAATFLLILDMILRSQNIAVEWLNPVALGILMNSISITQIWRVWHNSTVKRVYPILAIIGLVTLNILGLWSYAVGLYDSSHDGFDYTIIVGLFVSIVSWVDLYRHRKGSY